MLPLTAAAVLLFTALSVKSAVLLFAALLLILLVVTGYISVWQAARSMTAVSQLSESSVKRGDDVTLTITVQHRGLFPIAPVLLELNAAPGMPETAVRLKDAPGKKQYLTMPFHASHIGVCTPGIKAITL
ncbi:MAG: hypothetical protein Q4C54_03595 [Clostridia bacterium]|nr:hypothetical protein [Clostridia bacterium]